jgi:hypothetical protein
LLGTILAQLFFIPGAEYIAWFTKFIAWKIRMYIPWKVNKK